MSFPMMKACEFRRPPLALAALSAPLRILHALRRGALETRREHATMPSRPPAELRARALPQYWTAAHISSSNYMQRIMLRRGGLR
mmetsp:Transcript_39035/g.71177  ORF Transcript_39035/g.71177 Transcript_39035/m.71177 type:complete len:85 (+) Transcript_39035:1-255(+)